MKHAAYLFALAPLLGVTPALAQNTPPPAPVAEPAAAPVASEPAPVAEPAPAAAPVVSEPVPAAPAAAPAEPAPAAAPEPASLELFGSLSLSIAQGEPANPGLTNSFRRVGAYGEAGVAYRSKYFLDPFISVGYGSLASGDTTLPDSDTQVNGEPAYTAGTLHQHLGMWLISPGVTAELWRFRLRFGIGLGIVKESNRFHGEGNTATQLPLAWQTGLAFNCYEVPRFRLDAEARFIQAKGADVTFWTIGITGRGDLVTF